MAKVQLTTEIEPELLRQVERAAERDDIKISEWFQGAIEQRLQSAGEAPDPDWPADIVRGRPGTKPHGMKNPPRLEDDTLLSDIVI